MGWQGTRLQVDEDEPLQAREWRFQRVGWGLLASLVIAALLGVFGNGPLSTARAVDPTGQLRVDYDRFVRHVAQTDLVLTIAPTAATAGRVTAVVDQTWFTDAIWLEQISPQPSSSTLHGDVVELEFEVRDPAQPLAIGIRYRPDAIGVLHPAFGLDRSGMVRLRQLSYP